MSLDERAREVWAEVRQQVSTIERPPARAIARRSRRGRVATGLAPLALLAFLGSGWPSPSRTTRRRRVWM